MQVKKTTQFSVDFTPEDLFHILFAIDTCIKEYYSDLPLEHKSAHLELSSCIYYISDMMKED